MSMKNSDSTSTAPMAVKSKVMLSPTRSASFGTSISPSPLLSRRFSATISMLPLNVSFLYGLVASPPAPWPGPPKSSLGVPRSWSTMFGWAVSKTTAALTSAPKLGLIALIATVPSVVEIDETRVPFARPSKSIQVNGGMWSRVPPGFPPRILLPVLPVPVPVLELCAEAASASREATPRIETERAIRPNDREHQDIRGLLPRDRGSWRRGHRLGVG